MNSTEDNECQHCNGTGEGLYDGQNCSACHGSGIDCSGCEGDDYEPYTD